MRFHTAAFLASLSFACCAPALAPPALAQVVTGDEVSVNPMAAGGTVLLYPGGQYMRVVRPLLEPGEKPGPITLHMPRKRPARTAAAAPKAPARTASADGGYDSGYGALGAPSEPAPAPKAQAKPATKPAPKTTAVATATPRAAGGYDPGYGSFGAPPAAPEPAPKPQAAPPPKAKPKPAAKPQSAAGYDAGYGALGAPGAAGLDLGAAEPPATQVAKANPPPATVRPATGAEPPTPGLTKRSVILFAPNASDPAESALGAIKFLAGDLNAAMTAPSSRIQIQAYGGRRGDKGSDARRLSLKRALAIRQVLIDDGVAAERIDVRAMGGAEDGGPADRVDVYIKT